jgi:2-polyprenyl-6-methoxyphenol hydroxylase-like FAD-dependent oxidoreductase
MPHVAGVHTADGERIPSDLVVDCRGRRARLTEWLDAIGAGPAVEEREDSGFVYYGRHFRSADGALPPVMGPLLQHHAPFSTLTLPSDNGTWSVTLTTHSADRPMRALRDPAAWHAAVARCPLIAHWADAPGVEPITGIDVMAGLDDRHRSLFADGEPLVTGVVLAGDAWACTNPSLGRGTSIGAIHARLLQQVLRDVDLDDPEKVVRRFDDATWAVTEPLYQATVAYDRHRLAELAGEIEGRPYESDDPRWVLAKALGAAALTDPDALRLFLRASLLVELPQQLFADPAVAQRVLTLAAGAPRYPLPGPTRADVLTAIAG